MTVVGIYKYGDYKDSREKYDKLLVASVNSLNYEKKQLEIHGANIRIIWYNAIHKINFDRSNAYLLSDNGYFNDFQKAFELYIQDNNESILNITKNKGDIDSGIRVLKSVYDKYSINKKQYEAVIELYKSYSEIYDLVIQTSVSYNEYNEMLNEMTQKFKNNYNEANYLLPAI